MAHIREIRPQARELKFAVDPDVAVGIRLWARTYLDADTHGAGTFGDEYRTTSVYFDTDAYDVFYSRGSFGRSKYRIRRYGDEDTVFLERKLRQPAVLAKRRTSLSLTALPQLAEPAVEAWPGFWFHRRVMARRLRPVCQVAYTRMARSVVRNGEQVRLTLDSNIRALPAKDIRFSTESALPAVTAMPDRLILELKYRGAPPAIFRQLVEAFALVPQTASKYRMGVVALGLAQPYPVAARSRIEAFYA
jgi:VTC domain